MVLLIRQIIVLVNLRQPWAILELQKCIKSPHVLSAWKAKICCQSAAGHQIALRLRSVVHRARVGSRTYGMESFLDGGDEEQLCSEEEDDDMEWDEAVEWDGDAAPAAAVPEPVPSNPDQAVTAPPAKQPKKPKKDAKASEARKRADRALRHKVELLCLLAHCHMVDRLCADPLLQSLLLSLPPPSRKRKRTDTSAAESDGKTEELLAWFRERFTMDDELGCLGVPNKEQLMHAIGQREVIGLSRLEAHVLMGALYRAHQMPARLVFALAPQAAAAAATGSSQQLQVWSEVHENGRYGTPSAAKSHL